VHNYQTFNEVNEFLKKKMKIIFSYPFIKEEDALHS